MSDSRALLYSAVLAFVVEFGALIVLSADKHWLTHSKRNEILDASRYVDAEVVQMPEKARLVEDKKLPSAAAPREAVLSKKADSGRKPKPGESRPPERNQSRAAAPMPSSHGPVVVSAPPPRLPPYLKEQNLKASVVIDFAIHADGVSVPRLVGSSGNEELDALAIGTAKTWQFRPAENDHVAIYSKVRLRISFEVN